jgi:hypothetical protein
MHMHMPMHIYHIEAYADIHAHTQSVSSAGAFNWGGSSDVALYALSSIMLFSEFA